jgi:hypothetical protein
MIETSASECVAFVICVGSGEIDEKQSCNNEGRYGYEHLGKVSTRYVDAYKNSMRCEHLMQIIILGGRDTYRVP